MVLHGYPEIGKVVEPVIEGGDYRFRVRVGKPDEPDDVNVGTKSGRGALIILSGVLIDGSFIKACGQKDKLRKFHRV